MNSANQTGEPVFSVYASCSAVADSHFSAASYPDTIAWYINFENTVLSPDDKAGLYLLSARSERTIDIALPCVVKKTGSGPFAATLLQSMANYYTPLHAPLYSGPPEPEMAGKLLQQIIRTEKPAKIVLFPLDKSSAELRHYQTMLSRNRWFVKCKGCFFNWYETIDSDFYDYFARRPSKLQNTYKRKKRKFDSLEGAAIKLIASGSQLESGINDFTQVYNRSWKEPEPYPEFIPELMRLCATSGQLRLALAYIDDLPIAAQFWIVSGGTAYIFKLSHDKDYARFSPGTLLMVELMKHVIDVDHVSKVDFLSGNDNYKKDWMTNRQERVVLTAYNLASLSGLAGAAKQAVLSGSTRIKQFFDPAPGRTRLQGESGARANRASGS